jgi:DNA damage-binding protein 1
MTAVAMLADDVFIGAENGYNLFSLTKNEGAATDEERERLNVRRA